MKNFEINAKQQNDEIPIAEGTIFSDKSCMVRQYRASSPWLAFDVFNEAEVMQKVEEQMNEDIEYVQLVWVSKI